MIAGKRGTELPDSLEFRKNSIAQARVDLDFIFSGWGTGRGFYKTRTQNSSQANRLVPSRPIIPAVHFYWKANGAAVSWERLARKPCNHDRVIVNRFIAIDFVATSSVRDERKTD